MDDIAKPGENPALWLRQWANRFPKGEGFPTAAQRDELYAAAVAVEALAADNAALLKALRVALGVDL